MQTGRAAGKHRRLFGVSDDRRTPPFYSPHEVGGEVREATPLLSPRERGENSQIAAGGGHEFVHAREFLQREHFVAQSFAGPGRELIFHQVLHLLIQLPLAHR